MSYLNVLEIGLIFLSAARVTIWLGLRVGVPVLSPLQIIRLLVKMGLL